MFAHGNLIRIFCENYTGADLFEIVRVLLHNGETQRESDQLAAWTIAVPQLYPYYETAANWTAAQIVIQQSTNSKLTFQVEHVFIQRLKKW